MTKSPAINGFVLAEKLGQGSYASVFKAYYKGPKREVVAIKCVEKASLNKAAADNLITEIGILKKLKHEFIVEMKDFLWDDKFIYIIMEYCDGGELSSFIKRKRMLPEKVVKVFLQQLAKALQYLNSQNVAHLDLKPQNILLSSKVNPVLKLADFGFSQYLKSEDDASTIRGSPLYMAPEILLKHKYDSRVDLWSVGVILYECLFGRAPYSSRTFKELALKIINSKPIEIPYGVYVSNECRDLLNRLLQHNPDNRISFVEFFTHPFLDLEHMPSESSYPMAVTLVNEAVKKDSECDTAAAVRLYCESLQYFVAAIEYEKNLEKKETLRKKAQEYVTRAEELKSVLKPKINHLSPVEKLLQLAENSPELKHGINLAEEAEQLELQENFTSALSKYQEGLEVLFPILKVLPKGDYRDLLYEKVQIWLRKAEEIKNYIAVAGLLEKEATATAEFNGVATSDSFSQNCCIQ